MRANRFGRWVARAALLAALGLGVGLLAEHASANDDVVWGMPGGHAVASR